MSNVALLNVLTGFIGMHLEVQKGTVLIFNPISSSSIFHHKRLAEMQIVQLHASGIIVQTKAEVVVTFLYTFLTLHSHFHSVTPIQYKIEETKGLSANLLPLTLQV